MLALGSVRPLILESVTSQKTDYDLVGFLQTVVLVDLNQNGKHSFVLFTACTVIFFG